jgi:hypothetical protein
MKVISGGQTGVDRYGLEEALRVGIQTGGTAPKGWWTDEGPNPSLKAYGLIEAKVFGYPYRTEQNVKHSDCTVLFGNMQSPGCRLKLCKRHSKPYLENPTVDQLLYWIEAYTVSTLNVAGNRAKNLNKDQKRNIKLTLYLTFKEWLLRRQLIETN